jgi:hypothetical protein
MTKQCRIGGQCRRRPSLSPTHPRDTEEPEQQILRNQFYCINDNSGYDWMVRYMRDCDKLPKTVRERLAQSPFNICVPCLVEYVVRDVKALHPDWSRRKLLFAAIKVREQQIRKLRRQR